MKGREMRAPKTIGALLVVAALVMIPLGALANHPPTTDSGTDVPWTEDMNQESFWESYFGGAECTKFSNHPGSIPSQYEAAVVKSGSAFVRVYVDPPTQLLGPPNPNAEHPNKRHTPPFSWVMKCNIEETQTEVQAEARGVCVVNQEGIGLAYADLIHPGFANFTLNGQPVVGDHFGINASFGENTWTATAKPGFVLVGETEGSFFIEDCGTPGTTTTTTPTTTTVPVTDTTVPDESTTTTAPPVATSTPPPPSTPPTTEHLVELPFTGPTDDLGAWIGLGIASLALGLVLVLTTRREETG